MRRIRPEPSRRARGGPRGFTLIELMVSLVLFALVTAGMLFVAGTMARGFRDQEVTVSTEGATRGAIDFMAEALRGTSPGVPLNSIIDLDTAGCVAGGLAIANNQTAVSPMTNTSDKLTMVFASGSVVTSLTSTYTGNTSVTVQDASQLRGGDFVLISNLDAGHLVHVAAVTGSTLTLDAPACATPNLPAAGYSPGALVIRATRATFSINQIDEIPVLMMDSDAEGARFADEPIAEGIEDLEVAVGIDSNGDGTLSELGAAAGDDEWLGNVSGETIPSPLPASVRAVRISIVARTTKQFTGVNSFRLGALEDRAANSLTDNFRRRTLSSIVEIRNLGGSP